MPCFRRLPSVCAVILVIAIGVGAGLLGMGCGLVEDPAPSTARVVVAGETARDMQLVVSTVFLAQNRTVDFEQVLDVEVIDADTVTIALPFEQTYDITRSQRFLAQVFSASDTTRLEAVQLDGYIDGDRRFTRTATTADSLIQFVYLYQGSTPPDDGRL